MKANNRDTSHLIRRKNNNKLTFLNLIKWDVFLFIILFFSSVVSYADNMHIGTWVSVFNEDQVLTSKDKIDILLKNCSSSGIEHLYLQIYRSNKAYYDSSITDKTPFENYKKSFGGEDPIKYLLKEAKKKGINIYGWINLLSIAKNENADIIKKLGAKVITVDQTGSNSSKEGKDNKQFIREDQIFLEPGDKRVREYLISIASEIAKKYPSLSGLHLDYIRYPGAVPFAPGSRFDSHGISYGYNKINIDNFKKESGLDVRTMKKSADNFSAWDRYRRDEVTKLVDSISRKIRNMAPHMKISCAVIPSIERAYLVSFQNWPQWLSKELIDYVVAMDYTADTELFEIYAQSVLLDKFKDKIFIGVGAYLLKKDLKTLKEELIISKNLKPGGIVIFSYDEIAKNKDLQIFLSKLTSSS